MRMMAMEGGRRRGLGSRWVCATGCGLYVFQVSNLGFDFFVRCFLFFGWPHYVIT